MRNPDHPFFGACRNLSNALGEWAAIPDGNPLTQLIWATVMRSHNTFDSIGHLLGNEFDTQAAMLCRPLFEDMVVAHWLDYNRDDPKWLVQRFFRHREALTLAQADLQERYRWPLGPPLSDLDTARSRQNELGQEFKGGARRDWWDPGEDGHGGGRPIGLAGVASILEDAAERHERFHPRFAGGEEALLRRWEAVIVRWYSQQLHHTAIGLPFQPHPDGPVQLPVDQGASYRVLFSAYWMYGQQIYLLFEHLGNDAEQFNTLFFDGLRALGGAV